MLTTTKYQDFVDLFDARARNPRVRHDRFHYVKIGNNTFARLRSAQTENGDSIIDIFYHGNQIASLAPDQIYVSNCGWRTSTTRDRLNEILKSNTSGYYVRIKNFRMQLVLRNGYDVVVQDNFNYAFVRNANA